ncbi:hypothetical protein K523DRAFT_92325 [Schizophyllum commune Tattone D]|nr:hypothetical protein K523DRAFT_92325 [Schizophyllum commune Tattone D]
MFASCVSDSAMAETAESSVGEDNEETNTRYAPLSRRGRRPGSSLRFVLFTPEPPSMANCGERVPHAYTIAARGV